MTIGRLRLLLKRALGCHIIGHEWDYWSEVEHGLFEEFRSCQITACQRHERFDAATRRWVLSSFRRPGL
jgi:hypothetical protein